MSSTERAPGVAANHDEARLRELLGRSARDDRAAFAEFAELIGPVILGRARQVVRGRHSAEDVAQQVLLKVWQQAGRFDGKRGSVYAWVLTITRNTAIDRLRSEDRQARLAQVASEAAAVVVDDHEDRVNRRFAAEALRTALSELNEEQRVAIELAFFKGLSYVDVAETLGVPEGTIKSRIRRGMLQLSTILREEDDR